MSYRNQEDAFFGSSFAGGSEDAKLARELQTQLDTEDRRAAAAAQPKSDIDRDAEFAKTVYLEEAKGREVGARRGGGEDVGGDAEMATRLHEEEMRELERERGRAGGSGSGRPKRGSGNANEGTTEEPRCQTCGKTKRQMRSGFLTAVERLYCNNGQCFVCALCSAPINTQSFQVANIDGERVPCHAECYVDVMVPKCVVCSNAVPQGSQRGSYIFAKHPFFQDWKYCGTHESEARCTACNRVEPRSHPFASLGDGRKICGSCARTTILDSEELKPLFKEVLSFLTTLGLCVWPEMRSIPILSVSFQTLNERSSYSTHGMTSGPVTRGLCMTETETQGIGFQVPTFIMSEGTGFRMRSRTYNFGTKSTSFVTAILVLSGLPRDLTASILAHEAIHAWLKLHPNFTTMLERTGGIDKQAEEGVCQLVAHLFIGYINRQNEGRESGVVGQIKGEELSDKELRKFFLFSIESDKSEVYGEGFRKAAALYAQIGLEPILLHLVETGQFPR